MKLSALKELLPRFSARRDADAIGRPPKLSQIIASSGVLQPRPKPLPSTTAPSPDPKLGPIPVSATPTGTAGPSASPIPHPIPDRRNEIGHIEKQRCPISIFQAYSLLGRIVDERPDLIGTVVPVEEMRSIYDALVFEFEWRPVSATALGIALTKLTEKEHRKIGGKRRVCYLIPDYGNRAVSRTAAAA